MTVDAYPLHWPANFPRTPESDRQRARFNRGGQPLTIAAGRDRILEEITLFTRAGKPWRIDPDQVVISSDVPLRQDGLPASGRRMPDDPAVALYFQLGGEHYCLPCDTWDRVADNMAAIAAHLGAMRGMERWGVGDLRTHFAGFAQLEHQPQQEWYDVLGCSPSASPAEVQSAYKAARAKAHPDRGGSDDEFNRVQAAWKAWQDQN
ncbi:hypothetical protein RE428_32360 [Marinobacter nanhaiticus D15-8W]|uniref:J domain-containing protein n=1 Tax=Marinobacter nanhaiticus D15-8W TaxID=626887 RepID=N6WZD9_9GAMM|nr:J domain-containing protein [Marinobacter nanhaiticus]ENO16926.1 J domain-containing protein [Marinobacter nanhaiticus D15-8W]BES72218.1 hypothetical protein RE428_32360 [Marinobacter nanhaiticus D15-8W]